MNKQTFYLIGQGVKGLSFSCIQASRRGGVAEGMRGGVGLNDDVSTMIGSSFGGLSKGQFLALNLGAHHQYTVTIVQTQRLCLRLNRYDTSYVSYMWSSETNIKIKNGEESVKPN